jgi:hypothetical protein
VADTTFDLLSLLLPTILYIVHSQKNMINCFDK